MLTRSWIVIVVVAVTACGPQAAGTSGDDDSTGMPDAATEVDAETTTEPGPPGSECSCDADCQDVGTYQGVCIYGVCMTKASGACASGGSKTECHDGAQCWYLDGDNRPLCWPECSKYTCSGKCAMDGTCEPAADDDCDPTCGTACSCNETSCGAGNKCVNGACIPDVGAGPGAGPGPTCNSLPTRDCTSDCGTLVTFSPRTTPHYDDYPINGEGTSQYRSWLRRDLKMLVDYATAKTYCKSAGWTAGNGGALGLGDMSEADGAIPGTSIGSPGHPPNTHTNGYDIDLAYYQIGTPDNKLRAICTHMNGSQDAYHCLQNPTKLDVWRTALFLGHVFESTRTRVIGVDGKAGPLLLSALDTLCDDNWLSAGACGNIVLRYETTNMNQGWYYHHHHHAHISLKKVTFTDVMLGCLSPFGCDPLVRDIRQRPAGVHRVQSTQYRD